MNILLITTHFPPKRGGVETSNVQYLDFFEKQNNITATVLTYENRCIKGFVDYWKRSRVIRIKVPVPLLEYMIGLKSVSTLDSFLKQAMYSLLHICYLFKGILINLREIYQADKIVTKGALVETVAGYFSSLLRRQKYAVRWHTDLSMSLADTLTKLTLQRASNIGVNGIDIKRKMIKLVGNKGKNIFVSKNATNTSIFHPISQNEAREILNLPSSKFIILFAAALNEVKFCDLIIKSAPVLLGSDSDFFFVIIGEGPMEQAVEKLQGLLRMNVLFIDHFVSPEKLSLYMNATDIVIGSADTYYPASSVPESLACGIPVLLFNTSGHIAKRVKTLQFTIPLNNVFTVNPSVDDTTKFFLLNKRKIRQLRNDQSMIKMSRQYVMQNYEQGKILKIEFQNLVKQNG